MSQYLVLSHINVQNANSIAGLTWGFPAITNFLGFTHALSRNLSKEYSLMLSGCGVISNRIHNKVYQPKDYGDFEFLQSKNPPVLAKHKSSSPPIIEEGKMNLTVSLILGIDQPITFTAEQIQAFQTYVLDTVSGMRLAGGTILSLKSAKLFSASTEVEKEEMTKKIKRLVMPGFVLLDKSHYLQAHYETLKEQDDSVQLFDAWLDFSALRFKATPKGELDEDSLNENTPADWTYQPKPQSGWLVPLMTGYKAIGELYDAGEVLNVRDTQTSTRFVEAIHTVGEWKGAHAITSIDDVIWRYEHEDEWYRCVQPTTKATSTESQTAAIDAIDNSTMENALNLY